ncbi:MAG TPA: metallophosphoesterase family protein [Gaiellaceae bacterium]
MRVALFSDVHGNAVAFRAMLDDLRGLGVDQAVCLGDHAQGGPQPGESLDLLRELGAPAVYGNSDHFLLTLDPGEEEVTEAQVERARWSQSQLSDDQLAFHRSFEPTVELSLGGGRRLLAFHGTPRSRDEIVGPWMEEAEFRAAFESEAATIFAGGHTHQQWARRLGDAYYVNPGSVGLPVDHLQEDEKDPKADRAAEYAVLTVDGGVTVEFRRIPFDTAEVVAAIEASGMPDPEQAARTWRA